MSEEKNNDKEYLKDLAPLLFSKEMDDDRQVPDGYFDELEDQVMAKINSEKVSESAGKVRSLINVKNLSIAAGLALLLALIPLLKENDDQDSSELTASFDNQMENISEDAATLYLVEEYDLESIAVDIDLDETGASSGNELTEDEILNYLLDSEISESDIYKSF